MPTTQQRLQAVQRKANLTLADLAFWLGHPYQTVRGWVRDGREPSGPPQDVAHAFSVLELTETMLKKEIGFPVPRMKRAERTDYLKKLRQKMFP